MWRPPSSVGPTRWPVRAFQSCPKEPLVVRTSVPAGLNCAVDTSLLCGSGGVTGSPVSAFQIRVVLSYDAVTTNRLSGLNAAVLISAAWLNGPARCRPVAASQTQALLSAEAVATRVPSKLNMAKVTRLECSSGGQASRAQVRCERVDMSRSAAIRFEGL